MVDSCDLNGLDIGSVCSDNNVLAAEPSTSLVLDCERNSLLVDYDIE